MKKILMLLPGLMLVAGLQAQIKLQTRQDSASYAFGQLVGANFARQFPAGLNPDLVLQAMSVMLHGGKPVFDDQAANAIYSDYAEESKAKANAEALAAGEGTKKAGEAFLAANKQRQGVITTASGLQYEVLKRGDGTVSPKATDKVKVHYHGTNIDGSVFDSSVERGEPISFALNRVIPGWTEGVQLMHVGDKFKFYIPQELAYGANSPSPKIKPFATLIFEVELLGIE
jgi:FKBP-type peptidyl-prolyl cis-trans isomerase